MIDLEPPARNVPVEAEPGAAPPVTCEQLEQEAAERPRSIRLPLKITAAYVLDRGRIARRARSAKEPGLTND